MLPRPLARPFPSLPIPARRLRADPRAAAYTLMEVLIATALFVITSGIFFALFNLSLSLSVKNIALNDSNAALQTTFNKVLTSVEDSILVDCATFNPTAQTFTAAADGTWANSVRFMTILPGTLYIMPDDPSRLACNVNNPPSPTQGAVFLKTGSSTIKVTYNAQLYSSDPMTGVSSSARFYPTFPATSEPITTGPSQGTKPGLGIASVSTPAPFSATGSGGKVPKNQTLRTVTITLDKPMPSNSVTDCNRAYLFIEGALAVVPIYPNGPNRLLYFPDTTQPASFIVVSPSLDATFPAPPDAPGTTATGCFRHPAGFTGIQTLLPIRSRDYSNSMSLGANGGAQAGTNSWIRMTPAFRQRQTL